MLPRALAACVLAAGLAWAMPARGETPDLRCGQEPGNRFFWVEWAFCDLDAHGPEKARGIVIWNHGISGTTEQYKAPAALVLRLLHGRGWDAIKINRNNLGETSRERSLDRAVERTADEVRAQRVRGYRRVVLAGQSFGGYITLETAAEQRDLFGAVAMAPGITSKGAGIDRIDLSITDRLLQGSRAERVAAVFPQGDALFDHLARGPGALKVLGRRTGPYLLIDETAPGISGHGGGTGGRFALRYGMCLVEFLSTDSPPAGRFPCPEGREWDSARSILLRALPADMRLLPDRTVPPEVAPLAGFWYGLMGESVIVLGMVERGGIPRLLYRAATPRISAGVYEFRAAGGALHAVLGKGTSPTIVVKPGADRTAELIWTSADAKRNLTASLARAGSIE